MNNDDETNDANDNGNRIVVAQPETERQELLRLRLEMARGQQRLEAECLEAERLLQEQVQLIQLPMVSYITFKMMRMLAWSWLLRETNYLKC